MRNTDNINEGYFDNTKITDDNITDDINSSDSSNTRFQYSLIIGRPISDRLYFKERYIKTIKYLRKFIDNAYFIDDFKLFINTDHDSEIFDTDEYNTEDEIEEFVDNIWEDDLTCIELKFSKDTNQVKFNDFSKFLSVIILKIEFLHDAKITYISVNDTVYLDIDERKNGLRLIHFDDIFHNIFKDIFGINEWYPKCNPQYTGPVHLSKNNTKPLKDIRIGNFLYADDNGELTTDYIDDKHHPIAVCIMSENETKKNCVIFAALRFASHTTPDIGTENRIDASMYFGGDGDVIGCDNCDKTKRYSKGGTLATQQMYNYLNNKCYDKNWKNGILTNVQQSGYLPIAMAVWRFHTKGTKRGNWYIGSYSEYQGMFDKKHKSVLRNELRLAYSQCSKFNSMWTCEETNSALVYRCLNGEREYVSKIMYTEVVIPLLKILE